MTATARKTKTEPTRTPITQPKRVILLECLDTKHGIGIDVLSERLGWQRHTTHAALSRLRQSGHPIERCPPSKGSKFSRYRLADK